MEVTLRRVRLCKQLPRCSNGHASRHAILQHTTWQPCHVVTCPNIKARTGQLTVKESGRINSQTSETG